ncbi:MAG: hypothetical protein ACK5QT_10185 [Oligoflexia bacterium]|jgi:hypothetical protein
MSANPLLTPQNYLKGFLIDEELMGGVSLNSGPDGTPGSYTAFVLQHTTGNLLGSQELPSLEAALELINSVQRPWQYESASQCGGGACNDGNCGTGSCKKVLSRLKSLSPESCESSEPCQTEDPVR